MRADVQAADALHAAGDLEAAAAAYRRVVSADPSSFAAWYGLGAARLRAGAYGDAAASLVTAVRLRPDGAGAWGLLAEAFFNLGELERAIDAYRQAARDGAMRAVAEANIAVIIPGGASVGNAEILRVRRDHARRLAAGVRPVARPERPPSQGRLRIGYVSAFFDKPNWMKPVYGVINRHDRDRFELHLVSLGGDPSAAAGYRDQPCDVIWRAGAADEESVAHRLAAAGLDVLVDLNAYSAPKGLRLFAHRPAPAQVGWFNSFATSGLDCFDAIVGDHVVAPPNEASFYTEPVIRVRGCYLAFEVAYEVPDVAPPPCARNGGRLTFGSLASAYKLSDLTLGLWAQVLRAAPTARLLVRAASLEEPSNRAHLTTRLSALGVSRDRVDLEGGAAHADFLGGYDRIDIALDTFPYNGGTTTTEALWQGVPTLTYRGDRWAARTSASLMDAAGLGEWIALDADDLAAKASAVAHDPGVVGRLGALREGMRARLMASSACDATGLCRELERLYLRLAGGERP